MQESGVHIRDLVGIVGGGFFFSNAGVKYVEC
jgi:hypothetical protein